MRLVTINTEAYKTYRKDPEFLHNAKRPCVLVVKLKYKDYNSHFAVPLRSNIPAAENKENYFALPTRPTTRSGNRHGLHYSKMFPIKKENIQSYLIDGNIAAKLYKAIIDKNEKRIISECQEYLNKYVSDGKPSFATDIDLLLKLLRENN